MITNKSYQVAVTLMLEAADLLRGSKGDASQAGELLEALLWKIPPASFPMAMREAARDAGQRMMAIEDWHSS